ncbi:MAG: TonB-dependent receptor [Xanthomonadales bacterium]|nr:Colicin I receptor [Xanthomonadales bacterium]MCC6592627.1 TonB-dependent receptor [Xanthomonadales bacterium]
MFPTPSRTSCAILLASLSACPALPASVAADASEAILLDQITVTATLSARDARTAPASVTILDRAELDRRSPPTLLEALRGLPGVTLSPRSVGGRKTFSLRGLEGKHVLVLIDGRRISASDDVVGHSDYQYGWLPMDSVERIEVIRGPMSTLYGSEALGGVINIITRRPRGDWHGELRWRAMELLEGRGGDGWRSGASAEGGLGEALGLRVEAERGELDPVLREEDPRYADQEGSAPHNAGLEATLELGEGQRLEAGWRGGDEERWYPDVTRTGLAFRNRYRLDRAQTHLGWRGEFDAWTGQLRGYRSRIDIRNQRSNGVAPTRPQYLRDTVYDGHAIRTFGEHTLTGGFELREEYLRNAGLRRGEDDANLRAFFLQDEVTLDEGLYFTGGLRYDHHEFFGSEWSPRLYLVRELAEHWVFKAGYGHAFKAPTLKQISPDYVGAEGPHSFLGNPAIQPESSDSFELAVDWLRGPLNLRAAIYQTQVDDLITYRLIEQVGSRRIYRYDNVERARIHGLEAGAALELDGGFRLNLDLTLLRTRDRDNGEELSYRPRRALTASLDWTRGPWSARLGGEYTGTQRGSTVGLPDYTIWNASVARRFGERADVRLGLDNLGDVRLAEESADFGYAERGRSVSLALRLHF